jgi:MFS family permease
MTHKHHGLTSMLLMSIAMLIALCVMWGQWWPMVGLAVLNILSGVGIGWFYCAKCLCRPHNCSHILIGKVADFLPKRSGPYSLADFAGMAICAGMVFAFPLPWLWGHWWALGAFLGLGALAGVEIIGAVCPRCVNTNCPACRWPARYLAPKDGNALPSAQTVEHGDLDDRN